jgi:hypothetical protein
MLGKPTTYVANPTCLFPSSSLGNKDVTGRLMGLKCLLFETTLKSHLVHATIQSYAMLLEYETHNQYEMVDKSNLRS